MKAKRRHKTVATSLLSLGGASHTISVLHVVRKLYGRLMSHRIAAKITGVAGYVPPQGLANADLEKLVNTSDQWIRERPGIRERHRVEKGVAASHLSTEAAKTLLAQTKARPGDMDLIVLARATTG